MWEVVVTCLGLSLLSKILGRSVTASVCGGSPHMFLSACPGLSVLLSEGRYLLALLFPIRHDCSEPIEGPHSLPYAYVLSGHDLSGMKDLN